MWGTVVFGGMHPIGQILSYDERRESQNRATDYIHASIRVLDAPRTDEDDETKDAEVVCFINKYRSCSVPNEKTHPKLRSLVIGTRDRIN